jgi:HEPN domain-containing protein/predicted nucleotidyltransferase
MMKKSTSFLPENKQQELKIITDIIRDTIPGVEMVILYGSYARDKWVEERYVKDGITYEYISDFDILVLVGNAAKVHGEGYRKNARRKIRQTGEVDTPTDISIEGVDEVNKEIADHSYFFNDIKKEGILLYDSGNSKLARRRKLDPVERKTKAEKSFNNWFGSAKVFLKHFQYAMRDGDLNNAAFNLHQATEHTYSAVLLVFTGYKPKLHDLDRLGKMVEKLDISFKKVFPRQTGNEQRLYGILRRAYIEARYNMEFKVTESDLQYLAGHVQDQFTLAEQVCKAKIASFTS